MVPMFRCGLVRWNDWLMQRLPSAAGLSPLTLLIVAGSMEQEVVAHVLSGLRKREGETKPTLFIPFLLAQIL